MDEIVGLEQVRLILHIGKRKARFLLENGIIPCRNNGKKTRQYKVKVSDILEYKKKQHSFKVGMFSSCHTEIPNKEDSFYLRRSIALKFYKKLLEKEDDTLTVEDICNITGYEKKAVYRWVEHKWLPAKKVIGKLYVSKEDLLRFLASRKYATIVQKSTTHSAHMEIMKGMV